MTKHLRVKNQTPALEPREPGFKPQPHHSLAVCPWAGFLTSLNSKVSPQGDLVRLLRVRHGRHLTHRTTALGC